VAVGHIDLHLQEPAGVLLEADVALVVHVVPEEGQAAVRGDVDVRDGFAPRPLHLAVGLGAGRRLGPADAAQHALPLGEDLKVLDGVLDGAGDALPVLQLVSDDLVDDLILLLRGRGVGSLEVAGELDTNVLVDLEGPVEEAEELGEQGQEVVEDDACLVGGEGKPGR
jgi:hypothetical protein